MLKSIFRKNEIIKNDARVALQLTPVATDAALDDEFASLNENSEPVYTGPSIEEIKAEIENLRAGWQAEKAKLLEEAKAEAEKIIADAKEAAFNEVKVQTDIAQTIKTDAETKAEETVKQAEAKAVTIITEAESQKGALENVAKEKGFAKGEEEGFIEGKAEAERLIERIHTVLERINAKRQEILDESESQIVTLVLLIARKVIKIISDNQKEVVLANVHEALQKVRQGGDIIIRVNMDDVKLATEHSKEFITSIENASGTVPGISIIEDSSIGRGGCVVETDFGAVDARIANQLAILEQKILEFSPMKMKGSASEMHESRMASGMPSKTPPAPKAAAPTPAPQAASQPSAKTSGLQTSGTQAPQAAAPQAAASQTPASQAASQTPSQPPGA